MATRNMIQVQSPNVTYDNGNILVNYNYATTEVQQVGDKITVSRFTGY